MHVSAKLLKKILKKRFRPFHRYHLDKKSERKLYISSDDHTAEREREQQKIAQEEKQLLEERRVQYKTDRSRSIIMTEGSNTFYSSSQSDVFQFENTDKGMEQGDIIINVQEFPNSMMISKRYNALTRQTAAFINAVLQDLNRPQLRIVLAGEK